MSAHYTESHYENAILQLFQERLGYNYLYGPDVEREHHSPLYEAALLPALEEMTALLSDGKRILEILTYMAELTPEDIRKILIHSAVETMPDSPGSDTRQQKGR